MIKSSLHKAVLFLPCKPIFFLVKNPKAPMLSTEYRPLSLKSARKPAQISQLLSGPTSWGLYSQRSTSVLSALNWLYFDNIKATCGFSLNSNSCNCCAAACTAKKWFCLPLLASVVLYVSKIPWAANCSSFRKTNEIIDYSIKSHCTSTSPRQVSLFLDHQSADVAQHPHVSLTE